MIRREFLLNMLLALGSVLILALALELVLRVKGYDPMSLFLDREMGADSLRVLRVSDEPTLRYELTPDAHGYAFQAEIRNNSHGFRDREWTPRKGEAYRVAVLGDSIAFGSYMRAEDRFTDVLQTFLEEEPGRRVEVMNFAVLGYDTLQEVVTLEQRGLPFDPDLVMVTYCINDLGVVSFNERYLHDAPRVDSPLYRLRLAQFLRNKLEVLELVLRFRTANEERQFAADNASYIVPVGQDETLMALVEELRPHVEDESGWFGSSPVFQWYTSPARLGKLEYAFQRLARLKREHGFEVAVLLVPYLEASEVHRLAYRIVEHEARKHGFDWISLEREFEAYGSGELRFAHRPDDATHPNEEGHRVIAEKLHGYIAARAARDGSPSRSRRVETSPASPGVAR